MNTKKLSRYLIGITVCAVIFSFLSAAAVAVAEDAPGDVKVPLTSGADLINLINSVIGWVQVVFFTFAVLFIIFAAFSYLTSGGDPEKTKTAMNAVIYAIVAIAVAMISFGIKAVVQSILGAA